MAGNELVQTTPYVIQVNVQLPSTVSEIPVVTGNLVLNFSGETFGGTVFIK
jgi:hypothetical protein